MKIEAELQVLVNKFVADVTALAQRAAMETVSGLLSSVGAGLSAATTSALGTGPSHAPRAVASSVASASSRAGKRAAGDLASLQLRLRDHIRDHPGQRVTQINEALGTTTGDVRLPLVRLVTSGEVRTTGQKRATAYFLV